MTMDCNLSAWLAGKIGKLMQTMKKRRKPKHFIKNTFLKK